MDARKDYSDIGAIPVSDYSDIGAIPVNRSNTVNQKTEKENTFLGSPFPEPKEFMKQISSPEMLDEMIRGFALGPAAGGGLSGIKNVALPAMESFGLGKPIMEHLQSVNKIAQKIPLIGKSINELLTQSPKFQKVINAMENPLKAGMIGVAGNPEHPVLGGTFGTGMDVLTRSILGGNPIVSALGRAGLGSLIGQATGHPYLGAIAGVAGGSALTRALGLEGENAISKDMLEGLKSKDVAQAVKANRELKTPITPAQASGSAYLGKKEGGLKRTADAAKEAERAEKLQRLKQERAITNTLNKIYKETPEGKNKLTSLYELAKKVNIKPNVLAGMKANPVVDNAFNQVSNLPQFKNIPENNYEFLHEVDRQLHRNYKSELQTNPTAAYLTNQVKKEFSTNLKSINPLFATAQKTAQPKIVRENIEEELNLHPEEYSGKNFYSKFLSKPKPYKELLRNLNNFPEAKKDVINMRKGWKYLSNLKTPAAAHGQAETGLSQARDQIKGMLEYISKIAGEKGNTQRVKFIHSKDWEKSFDHLAKLKDVEKRNNGFKKMIRDFGVSSGVSNQSLDNLFNILTENE